MAARPPDHHDALPEGLEGLRIVQKNVPAYFQFTIFTAPARLENADNPWAAFTRTRYGLGQASRRLDKLARRG